MTTVALTPGRRVWLNALDLPAPTHPMCGFLEVDVTRAKAICDREDLSFTGFLIGCLARTVDEDKRVQGYRKGRRRLLVPDEVDVGMLIEHETGLMGHVVHDAGHKTCREIHDEIRAVQAAPPPANRGMPSWFRSLSLMPWPVPRLLTRVMGALIRRDPSGMLQGSGTTFISAVGMFGKGHAGWALSATPHSLSVFAGGIATKPAVVDGQIVPREILDLTVVFDHEIVDGAPATRFVRRFVERIEAADGLEAAA